MKIRKYVILALISVLSLFAFSVQGLDLHVPGCSWESTDLTHEVDVRVHQWIDITWDATPYHICDYGY
ncbi:MAG: hypothetical protein J7J43_05370, partial [Thermosipho sp. (in: Bacteria)]|nr:hypothetical protein [Thermosipho sp. (in: thermotogales)]